MSISSETDCLNAKDLSLPYYLIRARVGETRWIYSFLKDNSMKRNQLYLIQDLNIYTSLY